MKRLTTKKKLSLLSPEEQDLLKLQEVRQKALSFYSFGKCNTWYDLLHIAGLDRQAILKEWPTAEVDKLSGTEEIKTYFQEKEKEIKEKYVHPQTVSVGDVKQEENNKKAGSPDGKEVSRDIPSVENTLWTPKSEHPKQTCHLFKQQEEAAQEAYDALFLHKKPAWLLRAGVGTGKTFVKGAICRRIVDNGILKSIQTIPCPWPIVYVTKASIVEQTKRVLKNHFGLDVINQVIVCHYDSLRATFGEMFIKWETKMVNGEPTIEPEWKPYIHPVVFLWDECQALKNLQSLQSKVGQALNKLTEQYSTPQNPIIIKQIFASATPFTRVIEMKCFAVATGVKYDYGVIRGQPLINDHFTDWAKSIAAPSDPEEHNEAAMERAVAYLIDYIGGIKNLRPQFHARNGIQIIEFSNQQEHDRYHAAWDEHLARKAKAEGLNSSDGGGRMAILASFTIFRREAEDIRVPWLCKTMHHQYKEGFAPVAACCFKNTIAHSVKLLIEQYGIQRDQISIIWGGITKTKQVKKKKSDLIDQSRVDELRERMSGLMSDDSDLFNELMDMEDTVEVQQEEYPKSYRLGIQSKQERQSEIDRFQSGKTLFCFFTYKAGGVGLSLHHSDELTKFKCRRKPNNYVYEEDIPLVPIRQRVVTATPTYSAPEIVQGFGRCPRLTSLSDTHQTCVFYKGTIEEAVAKSFSLKLRCLKKVTKIREAWEDIVLGSSNRANIQHETKSQEELLPQELGDALQKPNTTILIKSENPDEDSFIGSSDFSEEDDED